MQNVLFRMDKKDFIIVLLDSFKNGMFDIFSAENGHTTAQREWIVKCTKNVENVPEKLLNRLDAGSINVLKKLPKAPKAYVLYDSEGFDFDEAKKFLSEDSENEVTDEMVYNYISDSLSFDFEQLEEIANNLDLQCSSHLIFGSVGTWRGRFDIFNQSSTILMNLIRKAINNMDRVLIQMIDGKIEISCGHHDGTNYFTIQPLNKRGDKLFDKTGSFENVNNIENYVKRYVYE